MPRLTRPPGMPQEVSDAIELIGNRARAQILHELAVRGPLSAPDLAELLGARRETVHTHLVVLEDAGLVVADEPAGRRAGRAVRWRTDVTAVRCHVSELQRFLIGD